MRNKWTDSPDAACGQLVRSWRSQGQPTCSLPLRPINYCILTLNQSCFQRYLFQEIISRIRAKFVTLNKSTHLQFLHLGRSCHQHCTPNVKLRKHQEDLYISRNCHFETANKDPFVILRILKTSTNNLHWLLKAKVGLENQAVWRCTFFGVHHHGSEHVWPSAKRVPEMAAPLWAHFQSGHRQKGFLPSWNPPNTFTYAFAALKCKSRSTTGPSAPFQPSRTTIPPTDLTRLNLPSPSVPLYFSPRSSYDKPLICLHLPTVLAINLTLFLSTLPSREISFRVKRKYPTDGQWVWDRIGRQEGRWAFPRGLLILHGQRLFDGHYLLSKFRSRSSLKILSKGTHDKC